MDKIKKRSIGQVIKYFVVYIAIRVLVILLCLIAYDINIFGTSKSTILGYGYLLTAVLLISLFLKNKWASLSCGYLKTLNFKMVMILSVFFVSVQLIPDRTIYDILHFQSNTNLNRWWGEVLDSWSRVIDLCLFGPIAVELVMRGGIQRVLQQAFKPWIAIASTALLWGILQFDPVYSLSTFLYGILLGWLYWRLGSVWPGIVLYVVNNTEIVIFRYISPWVLTGSYEYNFLLASVAALVSAFVATSLICLINKKLKCNCIN